MAKSKPSAGLVCALRLANASACWGRMEQGRPRPSKSSKACSRPLRAASASLAIHGTTIRANCANGLAFLCRKLVSRKNSAYARRSNCSPASTTNRARRRMFSKISSLRKRPIAGLASSREGRSSGLPLPRRWSAIRASCFSMSLRLDWTRKAAVSCGRSSARSRRRVERFCSPRTIWTKRSVFAIGSPSSIAA